MKMKMSTSDAAARLSGKQCLPLPLHKRSHSLLRVRSSSDMTTKTKEEKISSSLSGSRRSISRSGGSTVATTGTVSASESEYSPSRSRSDSLRRREGCIGRGRSEGRSEVVTMAVPAAIASRSRSSRRPTPNKQMRLESIQQIKEDAKMKRRDKIDKEDREQRNVRVQRCHSSTATRRPSFSSSSSSSRIRKDNHECRPSSSSSSRIRTDISKIKEASDDHRRGSSRHRNNDPKSPDPKSSSSERSERPLSYARSKSRGHHNSSVVQELSSKRRGDDKSIVSGRSQRKQTSLPVHSKQRNDDKSIVSSSRSQRSPPRQTARQASLPIERRPSSAVKINLRQRGVDKSIVSSRSQRSQARQQSLPIEISIAPINVVRSNNDTDKTYEVKRSKGAGTTETVDMHRVESALRMVTMVDSVLKKVDSKVSLHSTKTAKPRGSDVSCYASKFHTTNDGDNLLKNEKCLRRLSSQRTECTGEEDSITPSFLESSSSSTCSSGSSSTDSSSDYSESIHSNYSCNPAPQDYEPVKSVSHKTEIKSVPLQQPKRSSFRERPPPPPPRSIEIVATGNSDALACNGNNNFSMAVLNPHPEPELQDDFPLIELMFHEQPRCAVVGVDQKSALESNIMTPQQPLPQLPVACPSSHLEGNKEWLKYATKGSQRRQEAADDGSTGRRKSKMFGRKKSGIEEQVKAMSVKQMPFTDQFGDFGYYSGQVNDDGRPDGTGIMKYENGVFYEGPWSNGCQDKLAASQYERIRGGFTSWSGKGKGGVKSGSTLPWNAKNNDKHSNEKTNVRGMEWTDLNGDTGRYTGEVDDDQLPHGSGIMKYDFGLIAEGDWVHGVLREGPMDRMISAAAMSGGGSVAPGMINSGMSVGPGASGYASGAVSVLGGGGAMSVAPMGFGGSMSVGPLPQQFMGMNPSQRAHIAQQNAMMKMYSPAGSVYGGSVYGGSVYGGNVYGGSVYTGSGSVYGGMHTQQMQPIQFTQNGVMPHQHQEEQQRCPISSIILKNVS